MDTETKAVPTAEEWMAAAATKTLDMAEMDRLIHQMQKLWSKYERAKKLASKRLEVYEKVEGAVMQALKDAGKSKYHVDGLGTAYIRQEEIVRVPGSIDAKRKFFKALAARGEDILYSLATVNSQSLNAWYRKEAERARADGTLGFSVPGIDGSTMRESMAFRKGK